MPKAIPLGPFTVRDLMADTDKLERYLGNSLGRHREIINKKAPKVFKDYDLTRAGLTELGLKKGTYASRIEALLCLKQPIVTTIKTRQLGKGEVRTEIVATFVRACPDCHGSGYQNVKYRDQKNSWRCTDENRCPTCNGTGDAA